MDQDTQAQLEGINQQIKELVGLYRGEVSRSGISENEFWIWYTLTVMEGTYAQQDICRMWSLSKQTVNTIIRHMARKGLVALEVVAGTRNRKIIRLTEEGRQYGENIVLPIARAEQRAFVRLPAADRDAIAAALGKYSSLLREELHGTEQ